MWNSRKQRVTEFLFFAKLFNDLTIIMCGRVVSVPLREVTAGHARRQVAVLIYQYPLHFSDHQYVRSSHAAGYALSFVAQKEEFLMTQTQLHT